MKGLLKIRRIGNSAGAILPDVFNNMIGNQVPYEIKDNHLDINLNDLSIRERARFINNAFKDSDHYINEKQMEKKFSGWGPIK